MLAIVVSTARADEGMWLLNLIGKNYKQMKAQGFPGVVERLLFGMRAGIAAGQVREGNGDTVRIKGEESGIMVCGWKHGKTSLQQYRYNYFLLKELDYIHKLLIYILIEGIEV